MRQALNEHFKAYNLDLLRISAPIPLGKATNQLLALPTHYKAAIPLIEKLRHNSQVHATPL